jgi:LuxR family maltose regulon positive regulatory protein
VVSRPRLSDRIEKAGAGVVMISAPAGSGKSVLVVDWLNRTGRRAAWLSLDGLDNDPARFFLHFAAALRSVGTPPFQEAAAASEGIGRNGGDPGIALLPALEEAGGDEVIVLDDLHTLEAPTVLEFVQDLFRRIQAGPRRVFLTRTDPPLPLSRLRLSGGLLEIRQRDLRFTQEEARELLGRAFPVELGPDLLERLQARTEGWAAGLRMATVALQRADDPEAAAEAFAGSHELMVDYLLEETLGGLEEPIRTFLMETSILPRFTVEGCLAVTDDPAAGEHLRGVEAENLFLIPLDDRDRWYRYHHLFREFMAFRLETNYPDRVDELHRRASRWFEGQGDVQEALAQAASMDDNLELVALLDRHGYDILARSEFASFARWLPHVPSPLEHRHPMFLAALAWFRAQTQRTPELEDLLGALEEAIQNPPAGYSVARLREAEMHLAVLRAFVLRVTDRFEEAIELADKVLSELPPDAHRIRGIVLFNTGATHLRLVNMDEARRYLEEAYELCLRSNVPYLTLASLGHLGAILAQTSGVPPARRHLEAGVVFAAEEGISGVPAFAIVLYQLAHLHYLADELDAARDKLERGLALTRGERETDIHANVLIQLARVEGAAGNLDRADELLAQGSALAFGHNVKPFATTLDVERARLAEARSGTLQAPEDAPPSAEMAASWSSWREAEILLQLQHCLRLERSREAAELATRLRAESESRKRGVALAVARVAQAVLAPEADTRREALAAGVGLAASRGYVRPLLDFGSPLRRILGSGLLRTLPAPAKTFAEERLLPRLPDDRPEDVASRSPDLPEGLPEELTRRELEALALLARGFTNQAMAKKLFVSVNTVKTHLKRIFAKLGVSTRTEAVRRAQELGLLPPSD